jgi:hypothetical protein
MKYIIPILMLLAVALLLSCHFYKPIAKTPPAADVTALDAYKSKVFIYRTPSRSFLLENIALNAESGQIIGVLQAVPTVHETYIKEKGKTYAYKPESSLVTSEVHLFGSLDTEKNYGDTVKIPLKDIARMEVMERDKWHSTISTVFVGIGIAAGVGAIAAVIVAATKESCPFISVYDGEHYLLQGETFGGAVYPSLARADFVPLPAAAIGKELNLMISNELKEKQYTDYADLILVTHSPGQKIVVSPTGELWQLQQIVKPQKAWLNAKLEVTDTVYESDNRSCSFNDTTLPTAVNKLTLTFPHPGDNQEACLVLDLRNSYWLDDSYNKATSKLGSYYPAWIEQQKQKPASALIAWQEMQHLPLTISINTPQGWQEIMKLKTIGPLMNREVAIPLGILPQMQEIEIGLSTGFMFWELDKAQLATVEKVSESAVVTIKPSLATDEGGNKVLAPLLQADGHYLEQLEAGKRAFITYKIPGYSKAKSYSAFLHTYGYYEPIRTFTGPTDHAFLQAMQQPGAFTEFSKNRYRELIKSAYWAVEKE